MFNDILLYIDREVTSTAFISNAVAFAGAHEATLTGLYVLEIPDIPGYVQSQLPPEIVEHHRNAFVEHALAAEAALESAAKDKGTASDWCCLEGSTCETVVRESRYRDLVVLAGNDATDDVRRDADTNRIVLEAGRPVLVLPTTAMASCSRFKVLVAWNGSRESARALNDAMPILNDARWVRVVTVDGEEGAHGSDALSGEAVSAHLAHHGVEASARTVKGHKQSAGEAILALANEDGADLVVMGAYGHSRWRELVLGGATAEVLRSARLPVLVSH